MFRKKSKLPIDWSKIEASAPGKFVLIGDFGDLYERNVIAVAIDKRLKVTIRTHKMEGTLRLHMREFNETWEWPTRQPIFSMTKLVANYAEPLVYSEPMLQNLRPLLNEKYRLKVEASSQHLAPHRSPHGHQTASNTQMPIRETNDHQLASATNHQPPTLSKPRHCDLVEENKQYQMENPSRHDLSCSQMEREMSPREQADMAVLSFLLLYISLGDSFATSFRPSLDIEVESEIPMWRGLGSSTAFAVAMCTALMKVFRVSAEPTVIMDWTQTIDKLFHGEKSSLHSSIAIHGGYIYFQHGKVKSHGIAHQSPLKLMLIDTGLRRDPKLVNCALIDKLAQKLDTIGTMLNSVNELTSQTWRRMNDPDFLPPSINDSLVVAQQSLDLLGMGHQNSFHIFSLAVYSHLTVKQSQAGETVFLLYDDFEDYENLALFRENLKESGFSWSDQTISFDGVKVIATKLAGEEPFPRLQQQ